MPTTSHILINIDTTPLCLESRALRVVEYVSLLESRLCLEIQPPIDGWNNGNIEEAINSFLSNYRGKRTLLDFYLGDEWIGAPGL